MKISKKMIAITSLITLLPMPAGIILWAKLPDTVATHFGTDNQANGWSSRSAPDGLRASDCGTCFPERGRDMDGDGSCDGCGSYSGDLFLYLL